MADMVRLAGIDVSKDKLDVHVLPSGESRTVAYDDRGLAGLRRWLIGLGVALVAVEASGGYEREVSEVLEEAGLIVHRLNPLRVRRFAQMKGRLAKTNRLDARTIAELSTAPPDRQVGKLRFGVGGNGKDSLITRDTFDSQRITIGGAKKLDVG